MKIYWATIFMSIVCLLGLVSYTYMVYDEYQKTDGQPQIVECKDRFGREIIDLECIKKPITLESYLGGMIPILVLSMFTIGMIYMIDSARFF